VKPPPSRVVIGAVRPELDAGRYAVKRAAGDTLVVEADVLIDGHDLVAAVLLDRPPGATRLEERPMRPCGNDVFRAELPLTEVGRHVYTVEAWPDRFATWADEVRRKAAAGEGLAAEALEGAALVEDAARAAAGADRERLRDFARLLRDARSPVGRAALAADPALLALMARHPDRRGAARYPRELAVRVDPPRARFAAWYEMFPRSQARAPGRAGTFADCERRLPELRAMGFDVVYLPPIHPIGETNRKGRDNAPEAAPGDPGSPWAIGARAGGHCALEPSLGTIADFEHLVGAARELGMEIALDLALQCSPDHPYVREHPEWFARRPDGSIRYAENPPKRYQDIVPFDFQCAAWESLWEELFEVVLFWIERGVRSFRVDNPHTKPLTFWEWLIARVHERHADVTFLAEAFTRPKLMHALAKLGFTSSYTYFTWRNGKRELEEYFGELAREPAREYFRASLWPSTPDILPDILQRGGRPAFELRLVLAATLSPLYGIYGGYELCENEAVPGTEEYRRSEKYEIRPRDWAASGSLSGLVARLNRIRRAHPALARHDNVRFLRADDERVIFYAKATPAGDDALLVAVNLDPFAAHEAVLHVPIESLGIAPGETYEVEDLIAGTRRIFVGRENGVRLEPGRNIAEVLVARRFAGRESAFEYY
jgi:starch synthase (maltosyl-transferring)